MIFCGIFSPRGTGRLVAIEEKLNKRVIYIAILYENVKISEKFWDLGDGGSSNVTMTQSTISRLRLSDITEIR